MTAALPFKGPVARVLASAAEKIERRRGVGRRVGEFAAQIGGLFALAGEREIAGQVYEAADRACVDDDNVVFDVLCHRIGVPYHGYAMDGHVMAGEAAVPLEAELHMREWV